MIKYEAEYLAKLLSGGDNGFDSRVEGDFIVFRGSKTGSHSLDVSVSSIERISAHWRGYSGKTVLQIGQPVIFERGMYGRWYGKIAHMGKTRSGEMYFMINFRRRNGSTAQRRIRIFDIKDIYA